MSSYVSTNMTKFSVWKGSTIVDSNMSSLVYDGRVGSV